MHRRDPIRNRVRWTLGLKAIKLCDGVTFAQSLNTAKYDGMPRSAINSGYVDFVMAPEDIAREIGGMATHPHLGTKLKKVAHVEDTDQIAKIFKAV